MKALRKCKHCGLEAHTQEDLDLFVADPSMKYKKSNKCKECHKQITSENSLKRKFGLTLKEYDKLAEKQDYKCAICNTTEVGMPNMGRFVVDHNHDTNEVRGLLCNNCNTMLGFAGDSINTLLEGVKYLQERGSYGTSK